MNSVDKNYSVIILTHAPKDDLLVSLEKLLTQSIRPRKIILYNTDESKFYDNLSKKDEVKRTIEDNKDIIYITNIKEDDFDHGKARNDAMKLVDTDYALFLTDDAVPYDDKLCENLIKDFSNYDVADGKVAATYARQIAKNGSRLSEKFVREFNYPDYDIVKMKSKELEYGIKNYFFSNVCAMYDKKIFYELGGFEENIILNEDTFFSYTAISRGYKIVYSSKSIVYHSHNYSFKQQFNRNFDIGVSQSDKKEIFDNIPSVKEGYKLTKYVILKLLGGLHFLSIIRFMIECLYRYMGYKKGYNYKKLSIESCILYASNKTYFRKKK